MKVALIIVFLISLSFAAFSQHITATHVKWDGGKVSDKYGVRVTLSQGWYELSREEGTYAYILYERKEYKILKSNSRTRRTLVKRYNNKHTL